MYVLVHHAIGDPSGFWTKAQEVIPNLPRGLTLHHTLSATDGTRASCLWEADSVEAVRSFLEREVGQYSANEYREAENRDGVAVPRRFMFVPPPRA